MPYEICEVKRCKNPVDMTYCASKSKRRRVICQEHWEAHAAGNLNLNSKKIYKKKK